MRTPRLIATAVAAATLLAGCGVGGSVGTAADTVERAPELAPDQQVSITFESYNFGQAGPWTDTFNGLLARFHAEHPNITVTAQKPQGTSSNPAADAVSSVQTQAATGNAPDVAQIGFSDMGFVVDQVGAKPLDDLVGAEALSQALGGPNPYAPAAASLGEHNAKTYGMPFVLSTPVLYYNASLFTAAGLDPARPPATWTEVAEAATQIKATTGKEGAYADCVTTQAKDWCLQSIIRSNGGRVLSEDRTTLQYAEPASVQAVSMLADMVESGASPKFSQQQAVETFARGELAMILESSSLQGTFGKGAKGAGWELHGAPTPSFGDTPAVPTNSGAALYVLSDDPAEQRAAWELITFLTSDEAFTQIAQNIGYLPLRTGLMDSTLKDWAAANPTTGTNIEQLHRMEPWISFPGTDYLQIRDGMMDAVEQVVLQGADPQATLTEAQQRGQALIPTGTP
ncbi:ABC transporter substrate-binding protein [Pseudonocardia parietis]|uniref:Multiple sugar transport system substrate-binding protein n=1 Tax=Pseudonocardia parietis TaxID=570936 RepID=A0ABS4W6J1_9PSEU|nr:ABC transporter substrate-binding protein [Pseudonocardia parietis]MBP2371825.1 multiple sugar transport system substrate-binding protein [Pseudonocardia parietis]